MGYKVSANVNCYKCVDFSSLEGVKILVYLEGETYSVLTLTSDSNGWAYGTLDRSQYTQDAPPGRVKAYFTKDGYLKGCVKLVPGDTFVDVNNVTNHSYDVDILLVEDDVQILPPPDSEPVAEPEPVAVAPQGP
jgi:hypothetical protein